MNEPKTSVIIPVVYATDQAYMRYTLVSMVSALQYARRDTFYAFTVLVPQDSGIDQIDINERLNRFDNYSLRFIEMGNEFADIPMHISHITTPTFFRLCIPGLLEDYDKCIYLDGDTIICEDLQSLYSIELSDNYLAGVPAFGYNKNLSTHKNRLGIADDQAFQYINAGVLLMNLNKLREDKKEEQFLQLIEKNYSSQDQDILNVACYGEIKLLPYRYNVMTKYAKWKLEDFPSDANPDEIISGRKYPAIIHYADRVKPWNDYSCPCSHYWLSAAMSGICWDLFPDIPVLKNTPAAFAAIRKEAEDEKQRADKLKYDLDSKKKQVDRLQYDLDCVHASISFRIGRGVTYLPRKLRDLSAGDGNSDTNT
jgi:lipopolysaccharide biosynthesis glycosyltransferase